MTYLKGDQRTPSMPTSDFWAGKRVMVTGHTGFKGAWLSLWLRRLGAVVAGYSLEPPTHPSLYAVADVDSTVSSHSGDVRDLKRLMSVVNDVEPEIVIHMAAQSLVRRSYLQPVETYSINVMGTVNLLEALRRCAPTRAIIVVTSDKCYENQEWPWSYRESDTLGGRDPYSSSKGCAELVTSAYRRSYFQSALQPSSSVGIATVRAGNVIGGGDWAEDRLVPDLIKSLEAGRPITLRHPEAVRPWQHVLEPLGGYLYLAERLCDDPERYAGAWNFGPKPNAAVSVAAVAHQVMTLWDASATLTQDIRPHPYEAQYLSLDASKARKILGWSAKLDLGTSLRWTVEWYKNYLGEADMQNYTTEQIEAYGQMMSSYQEQDRS